MAHNEWQTLQLDIKIIEKEDLEKFNDVANFLIQIIEIVVQALEIGKVLAIGFLNPIAPLVQALIDQIDQIRRDLNQMGFYFTYADINLKIPEDWRGGHAAFERRMLARLTDRNDPTRPDLSPATDTLVLYIYATDNGVITDIMKILSLLKSLIAFFGQDLQIKSAFPIPQITQVIYGPDAATVFSAIHTLANLTSLTLKDGPPQTALVKWRLNPSVPTGFFASMPGPLVGGFIVTVSTFKDGIPIYYDRPRSNDAARRADADSGARVQPREYGRVVTQSNEPLVLHGGASMLSPIPQDMEFNNSIRSGTLKDGYTRVYGMVEGNQIVPLEDLQDGSTHYFQRTFYMSVDPVTAWLTGDFDLNLPLDQMPHNARLVNQSDGRVTLEDLGVATSLYVRVAATGGSEIESEVKYEFNPSTAQVTGTPIMVQSSAGPGVSPAPSMANVGVFSPPAQVIFGDAHTKEYLEAVKTAVIVLLLSRPDLTVLDSIKDTISSFDYADYKANRRILPHLALEASGMEPFLPIANALVAEFGRSYREYIENPSEPAYYAFRTELAGKIDAFVYNLYQRTGTMPEIEQYIAQNTVNLRTLTWKDLIGAYQPSTASSDLARWDVRVADTFSEAGANLFIARNPYCLGLPWDTVDEKLASWWPLGREPQMQVVPAATPDPHFANPYQVPAADVSEFLRALAPSLKGQYEKYVLEDGSIEVPLEDQAGLQAAVLRDLSRNLGSADRSPVAVVGSNIIYCRGIFANAKAGVMFQEASLALSIAGAASLRSPQDGAWIALRIPDVLPNVDNFLISLVEWVEAFFATLDDALKAILKYIEALQSRAIQLQQLIRQINALIQSLAGTTLTLPACSAMLTVSAGTPGIISDLLTAQKKPLDGPLAYGAGVALVFPFPVVNATLLNFLLAIFGLTSGTPQFLGVPSDLGGIGALPAAQPEDPVPDVL